MASSRTYRGAMGWTITPGQLQYINEYMLYMGTTPPALYFTSS